VFTLKRPSFTTDENGRVMPISYRAVDSLPDIVSKIITA
jgi:hypothetical protein